MGGREVEKMGVIEIGRNRALQGRGRQETVKEKVSQGRSQSRLRVGTVSWISFSLLLLL